jgi:hypothetical protein
MNDEIKKGSKENKSLPGVLNLHSFRKLILMASSRRLGVMPMGLPSYWKDDTRSKIPFFPQPVKEELPPQKIAPFFRLKIADLV